MKISQAEIGSIVDKMIVEFLARQKKCHNMLFDLLRIIESTGFAAEW